MSRQTKAQQTERTEAIAQLRDWIKPGDTVYTILDHVSSSGMSRAIRVVVPTINGHVDFIHPNWAVGKALQLRHWKRNGREQDALVVGGCGMDMGFHLVYELSHTLYGDGYACLGKGKCPSNYHVNHHDRIRCEGIGTGDDHKPCYRPDALSRWEPAADWPRRSIDIGDGETVSGGYMAAIEYDAGTIPVGTKDLIMREDGSALQVCPTCKGEGYVPNPEGPERFDLTHTDGYALRHRWL